VLEQALERQKKLLRSNSTSRVSQDAMRSRARHSVQMSSCEQAKQLLTTTLVEGVSAFSEPCDLANELLTTVLDI
jgi:hypothetical protein